MTEEHDLEPVGPWPWWAVVVAAALAFIAGFETGVVLL